MEEHVKALSHVKKLIEDLNNDVSLNIKVDDIDYVSAHFSYAARLSINDNKHKIEFERSIVDDLEVVLDKGRKLTGSDTKIDISGGKNTPLNRSTELTTKSPLDRVEIITKKGRAHHPPGRVQEITIVYDSSTTHRVGWRG